MEKNIQNFAQQEFMFILKEYILPLFDVKGNLKFINEPEKNKELISIKEKNANISIAKFYPCVSNSKKSSPFHYKIEIHSGSSLKKRAICILRELLKVAEYNYLTFSKQRDYGKKQEIESTYKTRTFDLAFEIGMCKWLTNSNEDESITLHTLISRLEDWASRTYEGNKVAFGIVMNFKEHADENAADYLHFLENDSSAVFTDGIYSGILLDKKGKVLSFLTKDSSCLCPETKTREIFVPLQFVDIAKFCNDYSIGIIALTNGEIIIVKDQAICFAKRGRKWIPFDWERVYVKLRPYFLLSNCNDENEIKSKIQKLYCTLLDVSFAHTGGCLALVIPEQEENISDIINERIDLYVNNSLPSNVSKESREKIEILTYLLSYPKVPIHSFFEIEKPLRKELLSLDGATVVSLNGSFYCAGSIVSVPGGSSGGGRTAATKKLANYGVGIKISEDGYIEAYGKNIDEHSPRILPLFKFK